MMLLLCIILLLMQLRVLINCIIRKHLCRVNFFGTRVINDWNNLTSDIVENSSLNSFKSTVDNYFYDFKFMFHS